MPQPLQEKRRRRELAKSGWGAPSSADDDERGRTITKEKTRVAAAALTMAPILLAACAGADDRAGGASGGAPRYEVDAAWPRPLPEGWILGQVAGVAVDAEDHVWVLHRPRTLTEDERGATLDPPRSKCCVPAPPVLEFDRDGNLLRSWGGPGEGYDWPTNEHGISIDPVGNVWIGGNGATDHQVLAFTPEGGFVLQIGRAGETGGSNAIDQLGRPAHMVVDPETNELYVADGYLNRRVIVFDAATGAYLRHWGAYGNAPVDGAPAAAAADVTGSYDPESPQFGNPVHCVRILRDGEVLVCDRANNRIQVFRKDGTYLRQIVLEPATRSMGSTWDVIPADAEERWLLATDGSNNEVHVIEHATGVRVGSFGRGGRSAGQFHWVHNIAVDSNGDVYTTEVDTGKRVQKFRRVGSAPLGP